jgi:winged helix domain-containing protein/ATPase family protein associated with various cellular activities (AAA)
MGEGPEPRPYADHWAHLREELDLLDVLLRRLLERARGDGPEVDALLPPDHGPGPDAMRARIEVRLERSRTAGINLPLDRLRRTFELSTWELEVIVLCLAGIVNGRYERVFACLQDDLTRRRPCVDLALDLLGDDVGDRAAGRVALTEAMPLRRGGLIELTDGAGGEAEGMPWLRLDERIAGLLLLSPAPLARDWLRLVEAGRPSGGEAGRIAAVVRERLAGSPSGRLTIALHGAAEAAAVELAQEVCAELGAPLLVVDLRLLLAAGVGFRGAVREAFREAILQPAALLAAGGDSLGEQRAEADLRLRQLASALDEFVWLGFVCSRRPLGGQAGISGHWLSVEVPEPDLVRLAATWRSTLAAAGLDVGAERAGALASRYRMGATEIAEAVETARWQGLMAGEGALCLAGVERVCRERAGAELGALATRVTPGHRWADIVLPREQERQLREVAAAAGSRFRVLSEWGLGGRLSRGRGLSALFSGAPGTGKTMAAEIIAGELGLDLYVVDLATVVSKYIGETEKNLSRVFDVAETTSVLLLFDEADALFGKRSRVQDAHDRYANIEVGYLLQRLETYRGLVLLATNLKANLDEAFLRRLSFFIDFPVPGIEERRRIWRSVLPPEAPLAGELDWETLARRFALAGGSIRGAAVHAAYQAAAANEPIGMAHLLLGVRRELDKLGRAPSPADFGAHWEAVAPR